MKSSIFGHMWYMPMIIGMYIFLPYVSIIVKKFKFKEMLVPLIITFIVSFALPNLKQALIILGFSSEYITSIINMSFSGYQFGFYIIIGYYIYNYKLLKNIKAKTLWMIFTLSLIITTLFQVLCFSVYSDYRVSYDFAGIFVSSLCLFEIMCRITDEHKKQIFEYISKISLSIFFVHRPLFFILNKIIVFPCSIVLNIIIYYIIVLLFSILIIKVLSKNKFLKKYLLFVN